jgi:hypothetical protein
VATVATAQPVATAAVASGSGTIFPAAQGAGVGGLMVQQGSSSSPIGGIVKKALIGGIAGAGLGAGYGFLSSSLSFFPPFMVVGTATGAIVGGIGGAVLGIVKGLRDNAKGKTLGMQAQAMATQQQMAQSSQNAAPNVSIPRPLAGATYKLGASGPNIRYTQRALMKMGLYQGKITSKLDKATADAIKHYEIMKGALPTGTSSPDLRASLAQDLRLQKQYA